MENTTPERKKIVLSCIQPTGTPTLGNYLGALKNWASMCEDYNCLYELSSYSAKNRGKWAFFCVMEKRLRQFIRLGG